MLLPLAWGCATARPAMGPTTAASPLAPPPAASAEVAADVEAYLAQAGTPLLFAADAAHPRGHRAALGLTDDSPMAQVYFVFGIDFGSSEEHGYAPTSLKSE